MENKSWQELILDQNKDALQILELFQQAEGHRTSWLNDLMEAYLITRDPEISEILTEHLTPTLYDKVLSPEIFKDPGPLALGDVSLAKILSKTGGVWGMDLKDFPRHTLICGQTGAGKTTLLTHMILAVVSLGIRIFMFEFKKPINLGSRLPSYAIIDSLKWNFLVPPVAMQKSRQNIIKWICTVSETFCDCFGLLTASKSFIITKLVRLFEMYGVFRGSNTWPSLYNFWELLKREPVFKGKEADYYQSTLARLNPVCLVLKDQISFSKGYPIEELLKYDICLELKGIFHEMQNFICKGILQTIYYHHDSAGICGDGIDVLIVLDEVARMASKIEENKAHHVPLLNVLIQRIREFKIGIVACSQEYSALSHTLLANTYTQILLKVGTDKDLLSFAKTNGLEEERKIQSLRELKVGQAVVSSGRISTPFQIAFPPVEELEKMPPNTEVLEALEQFVVPQKSLAEMLRIEIQPQKEEKKSQDPLLSEDHFLFLSETLSGISKVTEIYNRCGFSVSKGQRIKNDLLNLALISSRVTKTSSGRGGKSVILTPTERGFQRLGLYKPKEFAKGGIYHNRMLGLISDHVKREGYKCITEKYMDGKSIDIVFEANKKAYAIEFESTTASAQNSPVNFKRDIEVEGIKHVFFVGPTLKVLNQVKNEVFSKVAKKHHSFISFYVLSHFLNGKWKEEL